MVAPTSSVAPASTPSRASRRGEPQASPGAGIESVTSTSPSKRSEVFNRPRSGYPSVTARTAASVLDSPAKTTLGMLVMCAVRMLLAAASAAYSSEIGRVEASRRSAANDSAARSSTAWLTRSVRKATPVIAVTATNRAVASTASSPARQSRTSNFQASMIDAAPRVLKTRAPGWTPSRCGRRP